LAARGAEVQVSIETLQEIAFRYIWDDNRSSFYFKHEEGNPKRIEEEMVQAILNRSEKLMDTIPDGQGQGLKQLLKHFVSGKRIEINALSHRDWTRQNVDLLIREITEAEKRNNEAARRALIEAVLSRNVKEVRVRLEKGGNPNCVVDPERKETLLMWTIEEVPDFAPQFVDLLKEFLSFDPNVADSSGDTAAHMCVRLGAVPTLEALMELPNFDPNVPGKGGQMLVDRCMRRMIKNPGLWGVVFIKLLSHGKIEPGTRNRVLEIAIYRLDCLQRCLNDLLSEDALNKTKEFLERGLMKVREKVTTLESDRQDFALEVIDCLSQITTSLYREMPAKTMLQAVQTGLARLPNPYCRNSAKILRGLIRMMENKNALQEIGGVTKALKEMKANILAAH
jgi:ankyrin repeat protein